MAKNFIRGGQMALHFIRMFVQVSKKVLKFAIVLYLSLAGYFVCESTSSYQQYLLGQYSIAKLALIIQGEQAKQKVRSMSGQVFTVNTRQFLDHPLLNESLSLVKEALINSLLIILCLIAAVVFFLYEKGRRQLISENIRGADFLEPKYLKIFLKRENKKSDLSLGGVPLVKNAETQHILVTGTTGAGKSLCMMELMDGIRRRQQRAVVYDVVGTFIQHYYRSKKDIILNPLDERCPSWNIWQEGQDVADFEAHAASLMPLNLSGSDPFWIHSARTIFSSLAQKLKENNDTKNQSLLRPLFSSDLNALGILLKGTVSEVLVTEHVEKMALSIKAILSTYCKCLRYLKEEGTGPLFSIRKWLHAKDHDGWIFIASNAEKLEAVKPLISLWMDIAARGVLSLKPSLNRRIWFLIDELASLHRLPSLSLLLSQGRKYGASVVTAFQDIHQLRTIYGRDEAEALTAMYNTNVCYRTKCPDTAQWMSRIVGQREVVEKKEGFSYGANDVRDGVSMHQERRKEPLILDTEFLRLNDREAYLILPESVPITKIKLEVKERPLLSSPLMPRPWTEFSNFEAEETVPKSELAIVSELGENQKNSPVLKTEPILDSGVQTENRKNNPTKKTKTHLLEKQESGERLL